VTDTLVAAYDVIRKLQDAQADSEYQVEKLKAAVQPVVKPRAKKTVGEE
jgi:hypothetical protein